MAGRKRLADERERQATVTFSLPRWLCDEVNNECQTKGITRGKLFRMLWDKANKRRENTGGYDL